MYGSLGILLPIHCAIDASNRNILQNIIELFIVKEFHDSSVTPEWHFNCRKINFQVNG
jgi:hypothetical protein